MKPTNRSTLIEYCLRKLGSPVINIEVAQTQLDDRVDDALQMFVETHYDGTERTWLAYEVTQTDIDNGYVTLPDDIITVIDVVESPTINTSGQLFNYKYQVALNNINPFMPLDSINYHMTITNLNETMALVNPENRIEFTRHQNKLQFFRPIVVGSVIGLGVYLAYDTDTNTNVWNDNWLKAYSTALIKKQWGQNTSKYDGVQLLGGVTVDGKSIYDQAIQEIEKLEEDLREMYSDSLGFIVG